MATAGTAQDRIAFLRGLRAVRHFRPDQIPEQVVDDLLEVARWSGSSMNRQPWEFVVVRNRETLAQLGALEGYVKHLAGAALGIVLVMAGDPDRYGDETYDEGRLSERLMLAAWAYGIGSCIGWFAGNGVSDAKRILNIPEHRLVRTAISFGYPDEAAGRARARTGPARKSMAEIIHWDSYRQDGSRHG